MRIQDVYNPLARTLLISLHPQYVAEIARQKKIIEYRKRFFKDRFQAFVCTTGPQGGIALFLDCDAPIMANASALAKIGSAIQGDDYQEIYQYFEEKDTGTIIPIKQAITLTKLTRPALIKAFPTFTVPQSYLFLDTPAEKDLLTYLLNQECQTSWTLDWAENDAVMSRLLTH